MQRRVAISGKITSGKTTCSDYLTQRYGFQRVSFAEPIKRIVDGWLQEYSKKEQIDMMGYDDWEFTMKNRLFCILRDVFLDDVEKASRAFDILIEDVFPKYMDIDWSVPKNDKWRQCLQEVGGGRLRSEIDNNIWVNHMISQLKPDGLYICDDLRYQNEYEILTKAGFVALRLEISPDTQMKRIEKIYGNIDLERLVHSSEIDLDAFQFPCVINADQDLIWVLHDIIEIVEREETGCLPLL